MRIFVTGGSGFVGGHVIETLAKDHDVFAMARSEKSAGVVRGWGATAVLCNLEDIAAEHLAGVDVVVHAAAFVDEFGPVEVYEQANVAGTQNVLDAAKEAGVGRFILVSTNASVLDGRGQLGVDETAPYTTVRHFHYGTSKAEAERRVLAANTPEFQALALRPCFVWGPRDATVLPAITRMVADGGFVWIGGGRTRVSTTHVFNLVSAIETALTAGKGGEAYFIADEGETTMRDFLTGLAGTADLVLPSRSLPGVLVRSAAAMVETVWRLFGIRGMPPVTRLAALVMSSHMTVDTGKARRELGWTPQIDRARGFAQLSA